MTSVFLRLVLEGPVAVSRNSATVGGHQCLGYVPGGQLLGAFAATLRLDPSRPLPPDGWRLLGSGELRFGDALPEYGGGQALPMPLSFHRPKGGGPFVDLTRVRRPSVQLEQLRDGFLGPGGVVVEPARHHTMRTAIEGEGRAREGFLFGIEALAAGQVFVCQIDADDAELAERARTALDGRTVYLGRSRSAEFGRVRIEAVEPWPEPAQAPIHAAKRLVCWLVSDAALRDQASGGPRLTLDPVDLGLVGWTVTRSWIRTRRYSPFNAVRRRPDVERQVLCAGSVVVLEGPKLSVDAEAALRTRIARGIGEHRSVGLGRVIVEPVWPEILTPAQSAAVRGAAQLPSDTLGHWLVRRQERARADAAAYDGAKLIEAAMRPMRIPPSQWGEIRRLAREARYRPDGTPWLEHALDELLARGARPLIWRDKARDAFATARQGTSPAAIELAAARLVRQVEEP